jgi:hypothetical protein
MTEPLYRPEGGWRCFFCDEVLTTPGAARDHFGADPFLSTAACQIKAGEERGLLMALRKAEEELSGYREERLTENTELQRAYNTMAASIPQQIRRAEEVGYAKALADIEAGKLELEHGKRVMRGLRLLGLIP